jgi:hypothetical protein
MLRIGMSAIVDHISPESFLSNAHAQQRPHAGYTVEFLKTAIRVGRLL